MIKIKRATALIICICMVFGAGISRQTRAASTSLDTVRVKLSTNNATALAIGINGEYFIEESGEIVPRGTITLRANANGTVSAVHSAQGELYTGKSVSLLRTDMRPVGGYITLNSRNYLGHMYISVLSNGYIRVINEVPLAHYLYGVVAYEMNNTYPIEALRAQAIAAKSYVLATIEQNPNAEYHIGDTSSDQVYKGYNGAYTNVIEAVDSTISEVLTVNGKILTAYYSASNGGETTVPSAAWPTKKVSDVGFAIALDPYDTANPQSMKEVVTLPINSAGSVSQQLYDMLIAKLTRYRGVQAQGISLIRSVELSNPKAKDEQHNMTTMSIVVDGIFNGISEENITLSFNVSELLLYSVCTNSSLRCYWGEYSFDGTSYNIYHMRWGHGVGLSQRGAQQRANQGQSYKQILNFYYPGATLSNYSITLPAAPAVPSDNNACSSSPEGDVQSGNNDTSGMIAIGTGTTTAKVNLRRGAGTAFESLYLMPKGTKLTVYDLDNGWYYVTADEKSLSGFVISDYVKFTALKTDVDPTPTPAQNPSGGDNAQPTPSNEVTPTPSPAVTTVDIGKVTGSGVNLRIGPDTSYVSIKKLEKNTFIIILEYSGKWVRVMAGDNEGYIHADYVERTGTAVLDGNSNEADGTISNTGTGVTTGSVNLREGEGTSTKKLSILKKGTELELISLNNGWYKVSCAAGEGYVSAKYVSVTVAIPEGGNGGNDETEAPEPRSGTGVTTGSVNLREGEGTSTKKLCVLKKGTALELISLNNGWYKVSCAAGEGYVSAQYVRVTEDIIEGGADGESTPIGMGETTGKVNLREGASTSSKVLTLLSRGTQVTLHSLENGWYRASYGEYTGYIYAKYVKKTADTVASESDSAPDAPSQGGDTTAQGNGSTLITAEGEASLPTEVILAEGKTSASVNMRTGASTSGTGVLTTIPANTTLNILAEMGDWYYVLYSGRTGFCVKAYITVTDRGTAGIYMGDTAITLINATIKSNVNFRTGPDTVYPIIRQLEAGEAAMVYMINNGWCLACCNGTWGYISKDYVKLR